MPCSTRPRTRACRRRAKFPIRRHRRSSAICSEAHAALASRVWVWRYPGGSRPDGRRPAEPHGTESRLTSFELEDFEQESWVPAGAFAAGLDAALCFVGAHEAESET